MYYDFYYTNTEFYTSSGVLDNLFTISPNLLQTIMVDALSHLQWYSCSRPGLSRYMVGLVMNPLLGTTTPEHAGAETLCKRIADMSEKHLQGKFLGTLLKRKVGAPRTASSAGL